MAKSRGRDGSISSTQTAPHTTRLLGPRYLAVPMPSLSFVSPNLNRTIIPAPNTYDASITATPTRRVAASTPGNVTLYRPATATATNSICKNRAVRREVLFAQGKGGRNGMKTARFTRNSKVKC